MRRKTVLVCALTVAVSSLLLAGGSVTAQEPAGGSASGSLHFVNDVMPLLSKLGCNEVKCHGAAKGKNGFKLSMYGSELVEDFAAVTKSAEARRINKVEPDKSLFLLKATASIPHEGAKATKLEVGSPEYNTLATWVAQGALWGDEQAPKLVSIKVTPEEQILQKGGAHQLSVAATFSDGSQRDVTRHAVYTSLVEEVAAVDENGKVQASDFSESHILVTYMRQTGMVRIAVPQPLPSPFQNVALNNKIDELVFAKLQKIGIPPSELCSDQEFIRRAYLDVIGTLPTPDEARAFLSDTDPNKRSKLVDRLLADEGFASFWALKWGDLLRIKTGVGVIRPAAGESYYRWVRESIAQNMPYDQFVRELVTASGSGYRFGAANFFMPVSNKDPQGFAEAAALIFMGARVGCARCHVHPVENWTLDDNLGMGAFFAAVSFKKTGEWTEEIVFSNPKQTLKHPKTGQVVMPKFLDGEVLDLAANENKERDPRVLFADWLTSPQNPWFARNIVNRVWFWLLGRGIIHEADDLRSTNPPENPDLLKYLEQELVSHKYDLKHIYRLILNSKTYQLSSRPNQWNQQDLTHFSHYRVKRLGAEQLLDAVSEITDTWERFRNAVAAPVVTLPAGHKAVQIPDGSTESPFLNLFGRAPRDTSFESQRNSSPSMGQALYLVNSDQFQAKIANSPRVKRLLDEKKSDAETIDELYFTTLSRPPTDKERERTLEYVLAASKPALEQAQAEKKAAEEALARVQGELATAKTNHEAAEKTAKEAEATAQNVSADASKSADEKKKTRDEAAAKRKAAGEAKTMLDKLVADEKAANTALTQANQKLDAANAAHLQKRVPALQDVLWALLNTKEFMFNH